MLTDEQKRVIDDIRAWLLSKTSSFFLLKGSAGTGKSYCIRALAEESGTYAFTAPTNKATKVLKDSVTTPAFKPTCRTIYSLLALKLSADGEVKELVGSKEPRDLSIYTAIIVDEASMIPEKLFEHIERAAVKYNARFIFMGDEAQLPPINELRSKVWETAASAQLTKVMRHDNAILDLATKIRDQVDAKRPHIDLLTNHSEGEGVWKLGRKDFEGLIREEAKKGFFSTPNKNKVIAWTNASVGGFNKLIRNTIFDEPGTPPWTRDDRVIFASAIRDKYDMPLASVDDEGTVLHAAEGYIDIYKVWDIEIELDSDVDDVKKLVYASVLHEESKTDYDENLDKMADAARRKKGSWKAYWEFKELFTDLRYAYAITAHRAQGSTYDTAFVCWQNILRMHNINEAYRCLYVAATRPKRRLIFS